MTETRSITMTEPVTEKSVELMLAFLKEYEDYTLFLRSNYLAYGLHLGEEPFSGNYKLVKRGDEVVAVFCLFRSGSLIIHSLVGEPIFDVVYQACKDEEVPIKSVFGDWSFVKPFWDYLLNLGVIKDEATCSKEVLYSLELDKAAIRPGSHARLLEESDYNGWALLRKEYLQEMHFPPPPDNECLYQEFLSKAHDKITWGLFKEKQLVSIADFNAFDGDMAQVGGVYTVKAFRGRGCAKQLIAKQLYDAKNLHHIRKVIIFTDVDNIAARKVYESFGARKVGYYALFFVSFYR